MDLQAKRAELQSILDQTKGALAIIDEMIAEEADDDAPIFLGIDRSPNPYWNNYYNDLQEDPA